MITTSNTHERLLKKLSNLSAKNYYNPFEAFKWPETISENQLWMSPELLTIHRTKYEKELTEHELIQLSKWELVNFFSLNVHGIRDLMLHVLKRIHRPGFKMYSEYFHHFLDEENKHMWFFAEFCLRYGKKIYPLKRFQLHSAETEDIEDFVGFAQIMIFEDIGDYFNKKMMMDERLAPIIRQVNRTHHEDESRHLAMGRQILKTGFEELLDRYDTDILQKVEDQIKQYTLICLQSLFNPRAYQDAGIEHIVTEPHKLLSNPNRAVIHEDILKSVNRFLLGKDIIKSPIT